MLYGKRKLCYAEQDRDLMLLGRNARKWQPVALWILGK